MSSESVVNLEKCALIILDVAGTTTSINFVKETLLPYALKHAATFLKSQWNEDSVKEAVKLLSDAEIDQPAALELVKSLTESNSDNKGLKTLQGLIYAKGYESGELKAHVFDDVAEAFETWAKSRNIAIYSTGSIESQRLLFKYTTSGDLSANIFKYFDQSTIGSKTEGESYTKIVKEFKVDLEEVVFVTDNVDEAKAAKSVGIQAVLIKREGNLELTEEAEKEYTIVESFKELGLEKESSKRKNDDVVDEAPPAKVAKKDEPDVTKTEDKMEIDASVAAEKTKEEPKIENEIVLEEVKTAEPETDTKVELIEKTEKVAEIKTIEEEKTETDLKVDKMEEEKPAVIQENVIQAQENIEEKKEIGEETKENGEEVKENGEEPKDTDGETKENGDNLNGNGGDEVKAMEKVEEKENKSVLANGKKDEETENIESEAETKCEEKAEETEVKVKKLDESADVNPVGVEA